MESEASHQLAKRSCPTNASSLPQELMTAILVRFPVKFLLQLKCVSKEWHSLISSPQFVKTHLKFAANDHRFLLCDSATRVVKHCSVSSVFIDRFAQPFYVDYPVEKPDIFVSIVGSINGLICIHNGLDGLKDSLILWSPSTRKFKKVPTPKNDACSFVYGFGYDEVHDDYKVVGINGMRINSPVDATIYNLKSDSWRTLDDFRGMVVGSESVKLVNGKLHWLTRSFSCGSSGIISFDLVDENFGNVVQPFYGLGEKELTLGVLGSDLSMLCNYMRNPNTNRVSRSDVWVMKEYGVKESWTKLYTIRYHEQTHSYVYSPPLCLSTKGESLFVMGSALSIYNPEDKSFTKVTNTYGHLEGELYIESLVCPFLQTNQ